MKLQVILQFLPLCRNVALKRLSNKKMKKGHFIPAYMKFAEEAVKFFVPQ